MIIIDTNIIFSSVLSFDSQFISIILDEKNIFASPTYSFIEIFKHKEKILKRSKLSESQLLELLNILLNKIKFISEKMLSEMSLGYAFELCEDIDEKDTIFVAMTIELNGLLWTGDKKLIEGLKRKGFDKFYYPGKSM
jgi:predicted nucleic acid-binding protein